MEMAREPRLDAVVILTQAQEHAPLLLPAGVVEPRAAVLDVQVLDDAEAGAHRRGVREDQDCGKRTEVRLFCKLRAT